MANNRNGAKKRATPPGRPQRAADLVTQNQLPRPPAYDVPFSFDQAADVSGIAIHGGEEALDGIWLNLTVRFATHPASEGTRWEIWPHEAQVKLLKGADGSRQVPLGTFRAPLGHSDLPGDLRTH